MEKLEAILILFLILMLVIFLVDYIFIKRKYLKRINGKSKKKKKEKNNELTEIAYLVGKFKLNKNELPLSKLLIGISLINAFIISLVAVVILLLDIHIVLQLILGFVLLMGLIYSIYELLGRYLVKVGNKNGK